MLAPRETPEEQTEYAEPADGYQKASSRALSEGAVGDALYLADQALAAYSGASPALAQARLNLAGAKALLRGVAPFGYELDLATPVPDRDTAPSGIEKGEDEQQPAGGVLLGRHAGPGWQWNETARTTAAEEAIALLEGTAVLEGSEATESTIEKARALVLIGRPDQATAMLEDFLDTGLALAAPRADIPAQVTAHPGVDPAVRVRRTTQARMVLARARLAQGDPTAALVVLRAADNDLKRLTPGRQAAQLFRELGELFEHAGDVKGATTAYRQALEAAGLRPARAQTADCNLGRV